VNMLLEMKGVTVHYGKSLAIRDVSISMAEGAVASIIGANGSGKSTVLRRSWASSRSRRERYGLTARR